MAPENTPGVAADEAPSTPWPDLFGVYVPEPPAPPEPEPQPPAPPPSYVLKGLFASSASSWAIVADPGGEYLLRPGDELPGGAIVTDLTALGVFLDTQGGEVLISFPE